MSSLRNWWQRVTGVEALLEGHREQLEEWRAERARLEGLLDGLGSDVDAGLPGNQAQGLFRTLGPGGTAEEGSRDFRRQKLEEIRRLSHRAYALRPDAENILNVIIDFILGDDGIWPEPEDKENTALAAALDEIWSDEKNRFAETLRERLESLLLDGERMGVANLNPTDGRLEVGWAPPEQVKAVLQDDLGRDVFVLFMPMNPGEDPPKFFVLDRYRRDRVEIERTGSEDLNKRYRVTVRGLSIDGVDRATSEEVHGLILPWFWSRPEGAKRGRPELTALLDYVDIHDELLWATLEREKLLSKFILHVVDQDVNSPEEGQSKLKAMKLSSPPEKPRVFCTNDRVRFEFPAPDAKAQPAEAFERILSKAIYGGKGFPHSWSGDGSTSNLATAQAQEILPLKRLRRKQGDFIRMLRTMVQVQLELRVAHGSLTLSDEQLAFRMAHTEIGGKERQRAINLLKDAAAALSQMVADGVIKVEAANVAFEQLIEEAGFEVPDEFKGIAEDVLAGTLKQIQNLADAAGAQVDREPRGGSIKDNDRAA